jgi:hypothetical protein
MKILITKDIPQEIVNDLRREFDIKEEPVLVEYKSGTNPSLIKIIAEIIEWLDYLKVPATVFLIELSKEAAKDFYKNKAKIFKALKLAIVSPLKRISRVLSKVKKKLPDQTKIIIGIPIPNNYFGTSLSIDSKQEEEIAWAVANFIVRIESISEFIKEISSSELKPLYPLNLILLEDGNIKITWMDQQNMNIHEKVFYFNKMIKR